MVYISLIVNNGTVTACIMSDSGDFHSDVLSCSSFYSTAKLSDWTSFASEASNSSICDVAAAPFYISDSHESASIRKTICNADKIRGVSATEVKQRWRSEQINSQRKVSSNIDSSWRQKQVISWSGVLHKKCSSILSETWQRRKFELHINQISSNNRRNPVLRYYTQKANDVVEKRMMVFDVRRESNVSLGGSLRPCLSLKVEGRRSRLLLLANQPWDALVFAYHLKEMLEPGLFAREKYLDDDVAKQFLDRTLW